jgi:hypothetical protein
MDEKLITNMSTDEFDAVVDAFIARETKDLGELDAPLFYEVLREMIASSASADTATTIEVEGKIIDNQLVLDLPEDLDLAEQMRDITILVGGHRMTVKWKDDTIYPTAH